MVPVSSNRDQDLSSIYTNGEARKHITMSQMIMKSAEEQLLQASIFGKVDIVKNLIKCGANPCYVDDQGLTALHYAVWNGDYHLIEYLAEHSEGHIQHGIKGYSCLNMQTVCGYTALHIAIQSGSSNMKEICKVLVSNGSDPEIRDHNGESSIDLAQSLKYSDVLDILIDKNLRTFKQERASIQSVNLKKTSRDDWDLSQVVLSLKTSNRRGKHIIDTMQKYLSQAEKLEERYETLRYQYYPKDF